MLYSFHRAVAVPDSIKANPLFTYSYCKKIPNYDFEDIVADNKPADIIALNPDWLKTPMLALAKRCHRGFQDIWDRLVLLLGYGHLKGHDVEHPFYCNYWIMKKDHLLKYCEVAKRAMHLIETDQELNNLCHRNSGYRGSVSRPDLVRISGRPYYTFHPFVMERLICFYKMAENLKLVTIPRDSPKYKRRTY